MKETVAEYQIMPFESESGYQVYLELETALGEQSRGFVGHHLRFEYVADGDARFKTFDEAEKVLQESVDRALKYGYLVVGAYIMPLAYRECGIVYNPND